MSATLPPSRPPAAWTARRERSNAATVALMAWIAVHLGRRVARAVLPPITLYFLLFAPAARRQSARYLARALGRRPTWRDVCRHFHAFASTVLDRVYFVRRDLDAFDLRLVGTPMVDEIVAEGRGALLLGAHVGSFEALHAIGASRPQLRVAMAMYPDNARLIQGALRAIAPGFELGIIAVGRPGSTLAIRDWLDAGGLVGVLADRRVGHGAGRGGGSVELPFLGVPARFAEGPLRLALLLRRRAVFMRALYLGGNRYEIGFEPLADFTRVPAAPVERERMLHAALAAYVARLEALCRQAPYNWFNFHDFWQEESR